LQLKFCKTKNYNIKVTSPYLSLKPIRLSQTVCTLITNSLALFPVTYKLNLVEDTPHTFSSITGNKFPGLKVTVYT
jgi:hypothetical protein